MIQRVTIFLIVLVAIFSPSLAGVWIGLFKFYGLSIGFTGYVKLMPGTLLMIWSAKALRTASIKVLLFYFLVVSAWGGLAFWVLVASVQGSSFFIFLSVAVMYAWFIWLRASRHGLAGVFFLSLLLGPLMVFAKVLELFYKEVLL